MRNKKCLALAISSIIFSGAANAVVNLDTGATVAAYASEVDVTSGALMDSGMPFIGPQDVSHDIGFGLSPGAVRYIRYDLSANATFSAALSSANIQDLTPLNSTTFSLAGGGTAGDSFVIFQVTAGLSSNADHDLIPTDEIDLDIAGLTVTDQAGVTITYNQYEEGIDAQNGAPNTAIQGTKSLATASNQILDFTQNALALVCTPAILEPVDVLTGANLFTGSIGTATDNIIGNFQVTVNMALLDFTGTPVLDADVIVASADVSVAGLGTGIATLADTANAYALAGGLFTTLATSLVDYNPALTFTATAPAVGQIPSGPINIAVAPTAQLNYTATTVTGACALGAFARNGSQDRVTFLLTPGGKYRNFVRITNPSAFGGNVALLLTDDTGASATFSLGDVTGNVDLLAAGASTGLITIDDLSAAAVVANPALDITRKLRLDVFGEFGSSIFNSTAFNSVSPIRDASALASALLGVGGIITNGIGGVAGKDDINVQAFSQSADRNSFVMMQKD